MDMETNIKQELRKTYLIAEDKNMTRVDFRFRMLLSNNIKNLLRCTEHNIDDRIRIYYDITGKTSLKDYCIEKGIDETVLKRLVTSLMLMEGECTDYLMEMDNISLDPEHIFMENETVYFCYLPWKEGDILEAFHELITTLLDMGNSTDMESMSLLYELHGVTRHKYSLDDVMIRITRNDQIISAVPGKEPVPDDEDMEQQMRDARWGTDHKNGKWDEDIRIDSIRDPDDEEILHEDRDMYIPDRREAVSLEKKKRREERKEYRRQRMFERFLNDEEYEDEDYAYR